MESLQNNFSTNNNEAPSTVSASTPQENDGSNEILYFSINQDYKYIVSLLLLVALQWLLSQDSKYSQPILFSFSMNQVRYLHLFIFRVWSYQHS